MAKWLMMWLRLIIFGDIFAPRLTCTVLWLGLLYQFENQWESHYQNKMLKARNPLLDRIL